MPCLARLIYKPNAMKQLILIFIGILTALTASAQLSVGVKGGLNIASSTDSDTKSKPGFYAGVVMELPMNSFIGIQPEVVYSRQGSMHKAEGVKMWEKYNYLNIPVLAKFYLLKIFSLEVGPQFGFMLDGKYREKSGGVAIEYDLNNDHYRTFDLSLAVGLSVKVTRHMDISARYNIGLTNVNKKYEIREGDVVYTQDKKYKNGVFQAGLGFRF